MADLTDEQCDAFRRLPGSFNDMVRAIYRAGRESTATPPADAALADEITDAQLLKAYTTASNGEVLAHSWRPIFLRYARIGIAAALRARQPAQAVAVPDELGRYDEYGCKRNPDYRDGWNDCRHALIAASKAAEGNV